MMKYNLLKLAVAIFLAIISVNAEGNNNNSDKLQLKVNPEEVGKKIVENIVAKAEILSCKSSSFLISSFISAE